MKAMFSNWSRWESSGPRQTPPNPNPRHFYGFNEITSEIFFQIQLVLVLIKLTQF